MTVRKSGRSKAPVPDISGLRSAGALQNRRDFLSAALAAPALLSLAPAIVNAAGEVLACNSPNRQIQFTLFMAGPQLRYRVARAGRDVIEVSDLSLRAEGADVCHESEVTGIERYRVKESYPTRGVHSQATNICNGLRVFLRHQSTRIEFVIEVRAYNDGVAFRFLLPGIGTRIPDEGSVFTIPAASTVWFHDFEGH